MPTDSIQNRSFQNRVSQNRACQTFTPLTDAPLINRLARQCSRSIRAVMGGGRLSRYGLAMWVAFGLPSAHALEIFACEPEWAALARVLMPDAQVVSATHARQDPHHIEARPALIAQLRRADLAVCTGAGLEAGWLPMLQQRAGNAKVQNGALGMFYAAEYVALIDALPPGSGPVSLFDGDVHPEGNPHFHTDPHRVRQVARTLAQRLQALEPAKATGIASRLEQFESAWQQRIRQWEQQALPLRGKTVAVQHSAFAYLWPWLGMRQIADLEPKPGMPPTPGHLQRLLEQLRQQPPHAVVLARYQDPRSARWLVAQLGNVTQPLVLPSTVDDPLAADALGGWMDQVIQTLLSPALPPQRPSGAAL